MIVRDAILCDEAYTLANSTPQVGMLRDVPRPVPVIRPLPLPVMTSHAEAPFSEPMVVNAPSPEPTLTLARVAAWLAMQEQHVLRDLPEIAAELAEIREDAYAAGFDAGRVDGRAAAAQETKQLHELLKSSVDAVRAACLREQESLATQCVEIVATAITQIAGPLLATREAAVGAVAAALKKAKPAAELTVRVNPTQLALLETQREQLLTTIAAPLQLIADSKVALGGCSIESSLGTLDARLEVQLQGLFETLRSVQAQAVRT